MIRCEHATPVAGCAMCGQKAAVRDAKPRTNRPPCTHLGESLGITEPCMECAQGQMAEVFRCGLHGQCTVLKPVAGKARCATCTDWRTS